MKQVYRINPKEIIYIIKQPILNDKTLSDLTLLISYPHKKTFT